MVNALEDKVAYICDLVGLAKSFRYNLKLVECWYDLYWCIKRWGVIIIGQAFCSFQRNIYRIVTHMVRLLSRSSLLYWMLALLLVTSCKENDLDNAGSNQVPPTTSRTEQTLDSIYLYAQQIYLWNKDLADYQTFNPRKYQKNADELANFGSELLGIVAQAINPETGIPYEFKKKGDKYPKFSYIEEKEDNSNARIMQALNDTNNDFGFDMALLDDSLFVSFVKPSSPADEAGLNRGDRVLALDGNDVYQLSSSALRSVYSDAFNSTSMDIKVKKADSTIIETSIAKATYAEEPLYDYQVIETGGSKVGYMAYGKFGATDDAYQYFSDVFDEFAQAGIQDMVIDLRYNGGGFVSTAELLCNYILPTSENGKVLFSEEFNETMQQGKADILANQPYLDQNGEVKTIGGRDATYADVSYTLKENTSNISKQGSLETIKRVYFIISGNTASASELVINAIKPYVEVKTIGETSYGKPVGFFPITIDKYDLYLTNFRTMNANGESDYYAGFTPDFDAYDDFSHDFGDVEEYGLSTALQALQINVRTKPNARLQKEVIHLGPDQSFKGMVENRARFKE